MKSLKSTPKFFIIFLASIFVLSACASKVSYEDAGDVETVNTNFGSTDLQQTSVKMVDSLLTFPPMMDILAKKRPIIFIDTLKNKTSEHIDTESLTDTISTKLLTSGKFRFIDMSKVNSVKKQYDYQNNSGLVSQETAVKVGRQVGAEYMLYGNISSIIKRNSKKTDAYYKITMKLMDLESGLIEWQAEKEIRKQKNKTLLGL